MRDGAPADLEPVLDLAPVAWVVATEIDLSSTYVGGSSALVDALCATDVLRATRVPPDAPVAGDDPRQPPSRPSV